MDDKDAGTKNSLGTPHVYDLTKWLSPGNHLITICVDNRIKDIDVGKNSHSISDHTQTNWNGIVGKMELQARSPVFISHISVYPELTNKSGEGKNYHSKYHGIEVQ